MSGENRFAVPQPAAQPMAEASYYGFVGALENVDDQIGRLDEQLSQLYARLEAILRPEKDATPWGGDDIPEVSGVGMRVYRQADKLAQMTRAMQRLNERIDL